MHMIRHDDKCWHIGVCIMLWNVFYTLLYIFPDFGHVHFATYDFSEIVLHIPCADGDEIRAAVVIVPRGARQWYAVFVAVQVG